ncbi:SMP-30/gluconolactonase/LRE family protein [Dyella sp. C9]|uniref:SMP-30/gluconolactonase/LRE family protein n=1 Tax=Dyella sp. C9 TaxID=2202154 RepID=UPI001E5797DD|nr:SMP-30/gluconolactonase/LRE family protein [Dyella sp. C9]
MTAAPATMDIAFHAGNELGEGVLWCEREQALYWTDIPRATLYRLHPDSGHCQHWSMPERLASFALCEAEGWLLLALASRLAFFHLADGTLHTLHDVEPGLPTRCNDGACDRQGRFVFGTMHEPGTGARQRLGHFWRLNADLSLQCLALPPVAISNSIAFSPLGDTMYYCDSLAGRIQRCDYGDDATGTQVFAELDDPAGEPDGSCVDAEGSLWNAQWGLSRLVRYAPDGSVQQVLAVPTRQPTRPVLGGPRLDTLYVTSARAGLAIEETTADSPAGALFQCRVAIRGLPEPRFAGPPG